MRATTRSSFFLWSEDLAKVPELTAQELGETLVLKTTPQLSGYNVIKGFLNLSVSASYWGETLHALAAQKSFPQKEEKVMVEYSSPNTNKPSAPGTHSETY